ncbi:MAG TPA: cytochrome c [Gammaproteobacteria bacterium]
MKLPHELKLAACVALGLATSAVAYAQSMKPEDAITARRAVMRVIALNFEPIGAMIKGDIPFDAAVAKTNAARMASVSQMPLQAYFPEGSDSNAGEVKTRALPEIWLATEEFAEQMEAMRHALEKLAEVAQGGDQGAIKAQVGEVGKVCKSCHDDFRNS